MWLEYAIKNSGSVIFIRILCLNHLEYFVVSVYVDVVKYSCFGSTSADFATVVL